jgi:hypothetical protein
MFPPKVDMSRKFAHPASRFSEQYRNYKRGSFKTKGKTKRISSRKEREEKNRSQVSRQRYTSILFSMQACRSILIDTGKKRQKK